MEQRLRILIRYLNDNRIPDLPYAAGRRPAVHFRKRGGYGDGFFFRFVTWLERKAEVGIHHGGKMCRFGYDIAVPDAGHGGQQVERDRIIIVKMPDDAELTGGREVFEPFDAVCHAGCQIEGHPIGCGHIQVTDIIDQGKIEYCQRRQRYDAPCEYQRSPFAAPCRAAVCRVSGRTNPAAVIQEGGQHINRREPRVHQHVISDLRR